MTSPTTIRDRSVVEAPVLRRLSPLDRWLPGWIRHRVEALITSLRPNTQP